MKIEGILSVHQLGPFYFFIVGGDVTVADGIDGKPFQDFVIGSFAAFLYPFHFVDIRPCGTWITRKLGGDLYVRGGLEIGSLARMVANTEILVVVGRSIGIQNVFVLIGDDVGIRCGRARVLGTEFIDDPFAVLFDPRGENQNVVSGFSGIFTRVLVVVKELDGGSGFFNAENVGVRIVIFSVGNGERG